MILPLLFSVLLNSPTPQAAVTYKSYYEGLPDLDQVRPFASLGGEDTDLRLLLAKPLSSPCPVRPKPVAAAREICGPHATDIRKLLGSRAKGLPKGKFSGLWLAELERGQGEALLAQYDVSEEEGTDRYAAYFSFRPHARRYQVTAAGWFLEGDLLRRAVVWADSTAHSLHPSLVMYRVRTLGVSCRL